MGAFEEAKEWLIESLGMWWPDADEGKCRQAADAWREFAGSVGEVRRATDGKASALIHNNKGEAIDAFKVFWHRYYHKEAGWLWDLEKSARAMGKALDDFADAVEKAKHDIDVQISINAAVIAAGITAAFFTAGLASGAAATAAAAVTEAATACGVALSTTAASIVGGALVGVAFGGVESVALNLAVAQPMRIQAGLQDGYSLDQASKATRDGMVYGGVFGGALGPLMRNAPFNGVRLPQKFSLRPGGAADLAAGSRPPKGVRADLDPIDVATGTMLLPQTDVELPGALPLVFERTHLSSVRVGGWFGPNWASTVDERVQIDHEGVVFAAADGMRLVYPVPVPGEPTLPVCGPRWPLEWDGKPDGALTITDPADGTTRTFADPVPAADGVLDLPLAWREDRNGTRIDIDRDEAGAPVAVRHSGGYHLAVETEGPRVTALRLLDEPPSPYDPAEPWRKPSGTLLARYGYDAAGHLSEVVNSSSHPLRFTYDAEGRITSWTDRNDTSYGYLYDVRGRVVRTEGSGGFLTGTLAYDDQHRRVTVTNSLGHTRAYEHDDAFQITAETDELGHTTRTTWDDTGTQPLSVTDPLGRTTRYTYDPSGHPTEITLPDGSEARATYNALGLPLEVVEPGGARWAHAWDDRGNLLTTTDPSGAQTQYAYDTSGHLATVTDALGHTRRIACDPAGLPHTVTDALGHTTTVTRDHFGRITALTDPLGNVTTMGWTPEGKPAWRQLPDGARETWTWDAEGNPLSHTDPAGNTTECAYGPFDQPVRRKDPDGSEFAFVYDPELRLTQVTNPHGLTWDYAYDSAGRLASETDFNGHTLTYSHDRAGQLLSRTNGTDQTVTYAHDTLGRVTSSRTETGDEVTYAYDAAGGLQRATGPDSELAWERDPSGRVLTETADGSRTLRYGRDVLGRVTRRTTPGGADSRWTYDEAGRPVRLAVDHGTLDFTYDAAGRETSRHLGDALTLTQIWDAADRLGVQSLTHHPEGARTLLQHRTYAYRPDGHLTEIRELATGTRRFDLDRRGRISRVGGHAWQESYTYDALGNVTSTALPGGEQSTHEFTGTLLHRAGRTTYEHDAAGRLVGKTRKLLNGQTRSWSYAYNARDQLTGVTTPDGERWRYTYDPLGRRTGKALLSETAADTCPTTDTCRTTFTWDGTRLAEQTTHDGHASTWDYTPGTHVPLVQTDYRVPVSAVEASPLAQFALTTTPGDTTAFYAVITDHTGTPTELVTPDGHIAWQHRTTLWGTPLPDQANLSPSDAHCPLRFPGQYADPETGLHYNYFRYYDPETARYLTPDPLGLTPAPNPHAYVTNPHAETDPLGLAPCRPWLIGKGDDPLVPELADEVHKRYPGHVKAQGIDIVGADGKVLTDFDLVTRNAVIQVKDGGAKGALDQAIRTQRITDYPVIVYIPKAKGSVIKSLEREGIMVTRDKEALMDVIAP